MTSFWDQLIQREVRGVRIIGPGVELFSPAGALVLEGWLRAMSVAGVYDAQGTVLTDGLFDNRKGATDLFESRNRDAYIRDIHHLFEIAVPRDCMLVPSYDGAWLVPVDIWTPMRLCAALAAVDVTKNASKHLWMDLLWETAEASCRRVRELCRYMAYGIPALLGREYSRYVQPRYALYDSVFDGGAVYGRLFERVLCGAVKHGVYTLVRQQFEARSKTDKDKDKDARLPEAVSAVQWTRSDLAVEPGRRLVLTVADKAGGHVTRPAVVRYVVPKELNEICGSDLAVCYDVDAFDRFGENFDDLLRIREKLPDGAFAATSLLQPDRPKCYFKP